MQSTIEESKKYHYLAHEFRLRLELGKLELKTGRLNEARIHLSALEKDATTKGFALIAHKAAALKQTASLSKAM